MSKPMKLGEMNNFTAKSETVGIQIFGENPSQNWGSYFKKSYYHQILRQLMRDLKWRSEKRSFQLYSIANRKSHNVDSIWVGTIEAGQTSVCTHRFNGRLTIIARKKNLKFHAHIHIHTCAAHAHKPTYASRSRVHERMCAYVCESKMRAHRLIV